VLDVEFGEECDRLWDERRVETEERIVEEGREVLCHLPKRKDAKKGSK